MSEPRLPDLTRSFERHLRAENKSDRTVETYLEAVRLLEAFLAGRGVRLAEADRAQIEAFLADLLAHWKPATAANRYRSLKVFYAWLEDEGEIAADPMAKMKPPAIPEQPVPVLPDDALRRLFAACAGKDFEARRDTAMVMLLLDSGARRAELVGLRVDDLDFEHDVARVIGKGRREWALPFGRKTAVASTATSGSGRGTPMRRPRGSGLDRRDRSPPQAWRRCSGAAVARPASRACTPTSCATPSPTPGSPRVGWRRTSCGSLAGGRARCCSVMAPQPRTRELVRHTGVSRLSTGCSV
jgi:integrase